MKEQTEGHSNNVHDIELIKKLDWYRTYSVSANYNFHKNDKIKRLEVTTGVGDKIITLPELLYNQDRVIEIIKEDHSVGNIIVDGYGAETINGLTQVKTNGQYCGFRFKGQSSEWHVETIQNEKRYLAGQTYNGILLSIIDGAGNNWITGAGEFRPFFTIEGKWYMEYNFEGTYAPVITWTALIIAGVVFNAGFSRQACACTLYDTTAPAWRNVAYCWAQAAVGNVNFGTNALNFDNVHISGNSKLNSKPTWVD